MEESVVLVSYAWVGSKEEVLEFTLTGLFFFFLQRRPEEFTKQPVAAKTASSDSEDEDENSKVGKMPSSDESDA